MKNRYLRYLLQDEPDKVLSASGMRIRKMVNPLLRFLIPSFSDSKLHVVHKEPLPKDVPLIFASTHGFKDDIALAIRAISGHVYVLFASLPNFFGTINGLTLWINGVVLFDRKLKNSRLAARHKMLRVLQYGANLLMFPEGTWNKTHNLCVQKLYSGIYDLAKKSGALLVPIGSIKVGGHSYAIRGEAFDICAWGKAEGMQELRGRMAGLKYDLMEQFATGKREEFGHGDAPAQYWEGVVNELIAAADSFYDHEFEQIAHYQDPKDLKEQDVFEAFLGSPRTREHALAKARLLRDAPYLFDGERRTRQGGAKTA